MRIAIGAILAAIAMISSCTYAPNPESGKLFCGGGGACPKGYTCAPDHMCWKEGQGPADGSVDQRRDALVIPDAPPRLRPFIGMWRFSSGTVFTTCSDGSSDTRALTAVDYVAIDPGLAGDLIASFYCDWDLDLPPGATTTLVQSGQTCMSSFNGTDFTWSAKTFGFTTTNGMSAMLSSMISATFRDATSNGTCELVIAGSLTKAP